MLKKLLSEFLGTYLLVFCGTGAIVINEETKGVITHPGIAVVFGLVVFALVLVLGTTSGCHINPAVSIVAWVRKRLPASDLIFYLLMQFIGATVASLSLHLLFPANEKLGATIPAGSDMQSLFLEFLLTFFLILAILRALDHGFHVRTIAVLAGGIVGLEAMFAGPICGASMNPARSLGPALVSGHSEHLWIYFAGPILGGLAASGINFFFQDKNTSIGFGK